MAATSNGVMLSPSEQRGKQRLASLFDSGGLIPKCYRCSSNVYQAEKIGPVNDVVFHKSCFKCFACGQHLTLKNYGSNQVDVNDKEVYCNAHVQKPKPKALGREAMGINRAVESQKLRKSQQDKTSAPHIDAESMLIKRAMSAPKAGGLVNEQILGRTRSGPHIDAEALHIKGPLNAQGMFQKRGQGSESKHQYPAYVQKKRNKIFQAQKTLEEKQREEEDRLYNEFQAERKNEKRKLSQELDQEWEVKLKELTEKFDKEYGRKLKKMKDGDRNVDKDQEKQYVSFRDEPVLVETPEDANIVRALTLQFEQQKKNLEKNMTLKRQKKKEYMTLKLVEKEQQIVSDIVQKHSQEMLQLIAAKQKEIKQEMEMELAEARQAETMVDGTEELVNGGSAVEDYILQEALAPVATLDELPPPHPPSCKKKELYADASVFDELDEYVFGIAEAEHASWSDLVQQLIAPCLTDLEKVRAIFRWITVKDLNVMEFDETTKTDTPFGLLRGIKYGTETYHVLFMRLCSYAGLHCVEVKGKSKSVGYEPGLKFRDDLFNNTWNAVLVNGDWRLVQCNWGARHLVLNKDNETNVEKPTKRRDKIRYQYDEHYFLTDPDEFIQEFMADDPSWQLLEKPINVKEFEDLPFVRSVFFHFGMKFLDDPKAVLHTNSKGGAEVKIRIPEAYVRDVVFHYQLRYAERERKHESDYKGAKLDRFVFQSMINDHVIYSVHVPTVGEYFLEVFANKIDDSHKIGDDPNAPMMPFRLKCACKFRVVCESLSNKMHPLPNCAAGEWGPEKALRHFNLKAITHKTGVITVNDKFDVKFQMPRPLHFVAKLRMNGVDDHFLDRFIQQNISGDIATFTVSFPHIGQFGLDLYARPEEATDNHTLAHACKYLINVDKVSHPVELEVSKPEMAAHMTKDKWGPSQLFEKFGMKCINYKDPKIKVSSTNQVNIEISLPERVMVSYHFVREPDEDHRDHVSVVREDSGRVVKFFVNMIKPGNYLLAIYAKQDTDASKKMANVYNYMIKYNPDDSLGKKKSLFRKLSGSS